MVAWNMFRDNPVLGVGIGNYNSYYQVYARKLGLEWRTTDRSAHNLYLEVAAERGVLGLIVFATIIAFTLQRVFSAGKKFTLLGQSDFAGLAGALGISFITYLIASIFLHDAYPRFFWVLIGICWALPQCANYFSTQSEPKGYN
jgi:O-antigen ligase